MKTIKKAATKKIKKTTSETLRRKFRTFIFYTIHNEQKKIAGFEVYYIPELKEINPSLNVKFAPEKYEHPIYRADVYVPSSSILGLQPIYVTEEEVYAEAERIIAKFILTQKKHVPVKVQKANGV